MFCKWLLILLFLSSFSLIIIISAKDTFSKSQPKDQRAGKFLFNIVQFRNDPCTISNTETGICYTQDECSNKGGQAKRSCASGFGSCCLFKGSNSATMDAPISYFTNPSYPETDWVPNYNTYTIKVTDSDICQVRLDFISFRLSGPSLQSSPFGHCLNDRLAIFSSTQPRLGLSEGNLICGDMTDQHIYIPVNATQGDQTIQLFVIAGTSVGNSNTTLGLVANYTWNIKVTQIDCSKNDVLQAPEGCLQYFVSPEGYIKSFNFDMEQSPYPSDLDYSICIRRQQGFCGINLGVYTEGDVFKLNTNLNADYWFGLYCFDYMGNGNPNISSDYLAILGASTSDLGIESAHFCGVFDGFNNIFPGVKTAYPGPIMINVHTDYTLKGIGATGAASNSEEAINIVRSGAENGFRLTYNLNGNCYRSP